MWHVPDVKKMKTCRYVFKKIKNPKILLYALYICSDPDNAIGGNGKTKILAVPKCLLSDKVTLIKQNQMLNADLLYIITD